MTIKELYHTLRGVRKNLRLTYELRALGMMLVPRSVCRQRLRSIKKEYERLPEKERSYIDERVAYYCHLPKGYTHALGEGFPMLKDNNLRKSNREYRSALARRKHRLAGPKPFFYDSYEITRYFPLYLRWDIEGGDVNTEMEVPTITKSRRIPADGALSMNVLLKLNKVRHFIFFHDPFRWEEKDAKVIFRGVVANKPRRQQFIDMWAAHEQCDLRDAADMSIYEHLRHRYIMALEGNDVASNLKWIMSSDSIAVMPRPTCETWFMEGRLEGGVHYIEIADDYHDLMEKVDYYEAHPEEAHRIIENAHAWVQQFCNAKRERMISLLVMERYLRITNP